MQPVASPATVNSRKTSTPAVLAALAEHVRAIAPEIRCGTVQTLELAVVNLRHDVAGRRSLRRRTAVGQDAVRVELVDLLEGAHQRRARELWARGLQRLDEELGRRPAVQREQVDVGSWVRLLHP